MKIESKQQQKTTTSDWSNTFEEAPKRSGPSSRPRPDTLPASSVDVTKKFANAKAISSDMVFGNSQEDSGNSANLAKFQGSSSISSAQYFGREEATSQGDNLSPSLLFSHSYLGNPLGVWIRVQGVGLAYLLTGSDPILTSMSTKPIQKKSCQNVSYFPDTMILEAPSSNV